MKRQTKAKTKKQPGPAAQTKSMRFWLTFDLGVDGDHSGLFTWLDEIKAVECGPMTASFMLRVRVDDPATAVLKAIKARNIGLRTRDRLYLIWRDLESQMKGKFIAGKRKNPPWVGYASLESSEDTEKSDGDE
jgi:hypothetical protein